MLYTFVFCFLPFFPVFQFFCFDFFLQKKKKKDAAYVNIYTIPFQDNKPLVSSDSGHERYDRREQIPKITSHVSVVCQLSICTGFSVHS